MELSEYVPVAVNCCVAPVRIVGFAGVTAIEESVGAGGAACTVRPAFPETPFSVAETVVVPALTPVASPPVPMVATAVCEEAQVTELVRFRVEPSEYVPVAMN